MLKNDIDINYNLSDADNDPCNIKLEYSIDGGNTWITTTNIENNENVMTGNNRHIIWHSNLDIVNNEYSNVLIKLTPNDGFIDGSSGISLPVDINNIPAPSTPQNLHALNVSDTSYTLSWDASTGSVDYYRLYITNGGTFSPYHDTTSNTITNALGGIPSAYVTAYVVAVGPGGESPPSDTINFNMAFTPIRPINLYATHQESDKFLLHWQGNINMNSYGIEVYNANNTLIRTTTTQSTATFINNLSPGTYKCRVNARTISSTGYPILHSDWSDYLTVTLT